MSDPRLKIDLTALDEALLENSSLVQQVCDEAAIAVSIRATKKDHLKTVEALLFTDHKEILSKTGKATEKAIEAAVQTDPMRKQAFDEWLEADLAAAKAASLVEAVSTRSRDLQELSKLYEKGYFAIDSTKRTSVTQHAEYAKLRDAQQRARAQNKD